MRQSRAASGGHWARQEVVEKRIKNPENNAAGIDRSVLDVQIVQEKARNFGMPQARFSYPSKQPAYCMLAKSHYFSLFRGETRYGRGV